MAPQETPDEPIGLHDGLAARLAALSLVDAALDHRGGLEEAMDRAPFSDLEPRDRALARMIAMTLLRRLGGIDQTLATKLQKPPPSAVTMLLRLGVVQALYMDTTAFAAVDTTVSLAERDPATRPFKGLINAVLRGLLRNPPDATNPQIYAPGWLYARWSAAFGAENARAAIPARLAGLKPEQTAIDLCAAPGGKMLQLAASGAAVVALDRSAPRLRRVRSALERVGLTAEVVQADAAKWPDPRLFDVVLLDAPCSATGTFRRHPDVVWGTRPPDIAKLATVQARLLASAADRVAPVGRLIYCVCSLEPEEGEAQIGDFLKHRPDFALSKIAPGEGGAPDASVTAQGWLRILPHHLEGGLDGFFVARLVRAGG